MNDEDKVEQNKDALDEITNPEVSSGNNDDASNIKLLYDVPLQISVLLGSSHVNIKDLLQLQVGSVIEVDKLAGEPLEVLINNKEVARGEILVINENYGIRLTDIIDPVDNDVIKQKI